MSTRPAAAGGGYRPVWTRVVAVVVAWNRRELLRETLTALRAQDRPPAAVVVVDNASTDGSGDVVAAEFPEVDLVRMAENTGGAGGFTVGLARALALGADAIWLMDDDTVPTVEALGALLDAAARYPGRPALMASRVVWTDGRDHPMNTPRRKPRASVTEVADADVVGAVPIRSASFVSVLVDADVVRRVGLPVAAYFLWNDDFEFTTRVLRGRRGLYVPASVVEHRTKVFGSTDADPGPRFHLEVRNKVWLFGRSRGLAPWEKGVYGGATARRWVRTIRRSSDRPTLWTGLRTGLRDGATTRPATNAEVLADKVLPGPDGRPPELEWVSGGGAR